MKTLLFVLTLSGLSATNFLREYHYVKKLKTWAEAQSYCRETFTDLVTVRNQGDHDKLLSGLRGRGEYAWIGLYDNRTRWKWALGNADFNNVRDFSNWRSNEPHYTNKHYATMCVMMTGEGLWLDHSCYSQQEAVCYNEKGPSKYILVKTKKTWSQARRHCRYNYTELASVRNMSENNHVNSLQTVNRTWIGLYRRRWGYWSDWSRIKFSKWHKGRPDNDRKTMTSCVVVNTTTGMWWDVNCKAKHYFICQRLFHPPVQHKTTFKLKFQSEVDLNQPAVRQQMLEQLHVKLEKHGLPDFKLRWIQTDGQTFHKQPKRKKYRGSCG